ncbi:MAG: DUF3667 domain-containing protein [Proteobacteria bacterium]|nr:DUF3667 domain-containing protein [Pseudomonadota bacterium]MBS0464526.1 DUF3667 domain-containing protein [Pseudomonadota bacterium]
MPTDPSAPSAEQSPSAPTLVVATDAPAPSAQPGSDVDTALVATGTDALPAPTGARCGNCDALLFGPHCYRCGQPDHGLVRHFSSIVGDFADTVLQIDTRLTRTLAPLLLRPGFLTCEYFAGRRVRYVSPVRLFFFFAVLAFFVAQWSFDASNTPVFQSNDNDIDVAMTVPAVERARDTALDKLQQASAHLKALPAGADAAARDVATEQAAIRRRAERRITEITDAAAHGKPPPVHIERLTFGADDKPWDARTNPLRVQWLPRFANGWLNDMIGRAQGNLNRIKRDPRLLFDAWMSALPSTLFVLLPLFALLLKLCYPFKRRLYMEHFIVALHSHAFLCMALLLAVLLNGLGNLAAPGVARVALGWAQAAIVLWMPVYLWLMQKRVYSQGWFMTTCKFGLVGTCYLLLLSIGVLVTFMVKLVWL